VAEVPNPAHFIQVLPLTSPPTRTIDLLATSVGMGFSFGGVVTPLGLARFERSPLLHKVPFRFEPRALELFGFILGWVSLPSVPFSLMPWLLVKELVVLLEPGFVTLPHIREVLHFCDGFG
jgi:hypothetical protein